MVVHRAGVVGRMRVGAKVPANAISQSAGDDETEVASRRVMNMAAMLVDHASPSG